MTGQDRYVALDGLRGFAVLLVFCVHAAGNAAEAIWQLNLEGTTLAALADPTQRALFWLWRSHHGVFLFFVLSGFLIGRMWWPQARLTYASYASRRTLRIYPAFLVAFAASLAFAWWSQTWTPPDVPRLVANLFFLNGIAPLHVLALNVVTWSLFYEMTFYLAFPLVVAAVRAAGARTGIAVWAVGVAVPAAAALLGANAWVLCWSLLFLGVALAVHQVRLLEFAARVPAVALVAAYLVVTTSAVFDLVDPVLAILAFGGVALLLVAKSLAPPNPISALLSTRPLVALGRISYSFYLVHWMVVVLVSRAVYAQGPALSPYASIVVIFVAGFALSAAAATLLWWLAERPYFAWVRNA